MIGAINTFLKEQKDSKIGDCQVSAYKFNTEFEHIFENLNIQDVPEVTTKVYVPTGGTALYDAVARSIKTTGDYLSTLKEEDRPEKVIFVIITDGEENSSREFKLDQIKQMVAHQTEKYSWEFVYLGANQDAWAVGDSMNFAGNTKLSYVASAAGVAAAVGSMSKGVLRYRESGPKEKFAFNKDDQDEQDKLGAKSPKP
jgi:hypothetical protein